VTNKVLIFTKSVKLLEMLEFHLQTKRLSPILPRLCARFDNSSAYRLRIHKAGRLNEEQRSYVAKSVLYSFNAMAKSCTGMSAIDSFQEDPNIFVFLISTLAGGTGLNLTAANKVVVFGAPLPLPRAPRHLTSTHSSPPADPNWSAYCY
jgi:hypothetical protein